MPIFQDDLDGHDQPYAHRPNHRPSPHVAPPALVLRRVSEESLPTELCEGPLPDTPTRFLPPRPDDEAAVSCRAELIERLKRGESPTWIPNRRLEPFLQSHDTSASPRRAAPEPSREPSTTHVQPSQTCRNFQEHRLQDGLSIERPRSALHSGDFTSSQADHNRRPTGDGEHVDIPRLVSDSTWIATSPPRDFNPFRNQHRKVPRRDEGGCGTVAAVPLSSSVSSNFAYCPPTSPLVQSESNDDNVDNGLGVAGSGLFSREPRQRFRALSSTASVLSASPSRWLSVPSPGSLLGRREPYQAHQPRRSLSSNYSTHLHDTSPQTPASIRARRPSLGSESSPIQHASMVGSYEESILRGRMSTTPSKPFDFLAVIGVLGRGKCKNNLLCPPHVTLSFPAVYYNYSNTLHSRSLSNDGPSPYVGQIDLENGLSHIAAEERKPRDKRKACGRYKDGLIQDCPDDVAMSDFIVDEFSQGSRRRESRTGPSRAPPGGSYRIPEKGQIQIIIKNQNKTAVKLFLIPYDLTGMEPSTKTFIRQRSYSAGPIIDNIPNAINTDAQSRPMLRYLAHLHVCCPSKGRFYLYKSIRVVFANRVPEGKERLRIETTWPEPRFTPYRPVRVMHPAVTADKALRRRSLGVSFTSRQGMGELNSPADATLPLDTLFRLPQHPPFDDTSPASTSAAGLRSSPNPSLSPSTQHWPWPSHYEKLVKADARYGSPGGKILPATESLLSQRLRSIGVHSTPKASRNSDA